MTLAPGTHDPIPGDPTDQGVWGVEAYSLSPDQMLNLSHELFANKPPKPTPGTPEYVCYRFEGDSPYANIGRTLEQQIFNEAFPEHPHTPEEMHKEYGAYEAASTFLISFDTETHQPAGVIRIIKNSPAGLKTLNDLAKPADGEVEIRDWQLDTDEFMKAYGIESLDDCWDIGTLGVLKERRSSAMKVSMQLYRALYASIMDQESGVVHGVSIIDEKALGQLKKYMGLPMRRVPGTTPFTYLGSKAEATYSRADEYKREMLKKIASITAGAIALTAASAVPSQRRQMKRAWQLDEALIFFITGRDDSGSRDGSLQFPVNIRK